MTRAFFLCMMCLGAAVRADEPRIDLNLGAIYSEKTMADCFTSVGKGLLRMLHVEKAFQPLDLHFFSEGLQTWSVSWKLNAPDGTPSAFQLRAEIYAIPTRGAWKCASRDAPIDPAAQLYDTQNDKSIVRLYLNRGPFTDHRALVDDPQALVALQERAKKNGEPQSLASRPHAPRQAGEAAH